MMRVCLSKHSLFSVVFESYLQHLQQGICNSEFYGDLVYFKKIIGNPNLSDLFKSIVNCFKRAGYNLDIMQQAACLFFFNPIMVEGYAALFSCTAVVQASDSMTASM